VSAIVNFAGNTTTTVTYILASISQVSATRDTTTGYYNAQVTPNTTIYNVSSFACCPVGPVRISLSGTTTVYLVAQSGFAVSTSTAYGAIIARRVR
jgi:hypothetical protein